jgi:hypothetical protein
MVIPIGGRPIKIKEADSEVDLEWLRAIVNKVHDLSRRTIARPRLPTHDESSFNSTDWQHKGGHIEAWWKKEIIGFG